MGRAWYRAIRAKAYDGGAGHTTSRVWLRDAKRLRWCPVDQDNHSGRPIPHDGGDVLAQDAAMAKKSERRGLQRLGRIINQITDPAIRKRGFIHTEIINRWNAIVGKELSDASIPQRISHPTRHGEPAVLHVCVESARATEFQHMTPLVIERVNTYFGYRAIGAVRLSQDEIKKASPRASAPAATPDLELPAALGDRIAETRDPALREALKALGKRLHSS